MTNYIKIKYWWSEDKKWFCVLTDDGNNQSTVSLTVEEASLLSMNAVLEGHGDVAQAKPDYGAEAQFLLDRLDEFDPGEEDAEREYHGHVAPAIARLRSALSSTTLGGEAK